MTGDIVTATHSSIAKAAKARDKPEKPYEIRSESLRGLLLRVEPSGNRTYYVQVARGKRVRIGPAGTYTLKQAEESARKFIVDPQAIVQKKSGQALTLEDYIDQHYNAHALAQMKNGQKSVARVKAIWKPLLSRRLTDIHASEIDRMRNKRINDGLSPSTVNRDVSALSWSWTGQPSNQGLSLLRKETLPQCYSRIYAKQFQLA